MSVYYRVLNTWVSQRCIGELYMVNVKGVSSMKSFLDTNFPSMSSPKRDNLMQAGSWKSEYEERDRFEAKYHQIAHTYFGEALDTENRGQVFINLFEDFKPIASTFVRTVLRNDNVAGDELKANLIGDDAEGGSEATIRTLGAWSFDNFDYEHTPGNTGNYDLLPTDGSTETPTSGEQAWMIMGWADYSDGRVFPADYIQANINDDIGDREPVFIKNQMETAESLGIAKLEKGPLLVEPGEDLDVDLNVTQTNMKMRLRPIGIEVITADASDYGTGW